MNIKDNLYKQCKAQLNQRLEVCQAAIAKIQDDLLSETKSSAGDKHETGRAMLQLEREKLGQQVLNIENELTLLSRVDTQNASKIVRLGSLVYTTNHNYYLAISAGELSYKNENFFAISVNTPVGKLLLSKTVGDSIPFRNDTFVITKIE